MGMLERLLCWLGGWRPSVAPQQQKKKTGKQQVLQSEVTPPPPKAHVEQDLEGQQKAAAWPDEGKAQDPWQQQSRRHRSLLGLPILRPDAKQVVMWDTVMSLLDLTYTGGLSKSLKYSAASSCLLLPCAALLEFYGLSSCSEPAAAHCWPVHAAFLVPLSLAFDSVEGKHFSWFNGVNCAGSKHTAALSLCILLCRCSLCAATSTRRQAEENKRFIYPCLCSCVLRGGHSYGISHRLCGRT
jgi:hypothetical protein